MYRENTEWSELYWFDTAFTELPRILLVGDSIVAGSRDALAAALKGKAVVSAYATSRLVGEPVFNRELDLMLSDGPVDLICVNNGLHCFDCGDEEYGARLKACLENLRRNTRARIVWRNSTPITVMDDPATLDPVKNGVVERRNRVAAQVMAELGIPVIDLYSQMLNHPEYRKADGYHYLEAGVQAQAAFLAPELLKQLGRQQLPVTLNGFKTDYPGRVGLWHGYETYRFHLDGVPCVLVKPNCEPDPAMRWYWRAHFFGAFPDADFALLKRGWYVAHIAVPELYGSAEVIRRFDTFYQFMTRMGFNKKCVPVGYSRGGLDVYNWAVRNTDKVSCLYLDNPVCDFRSWPGGMGHGKRYEESWQNCLAAWNFTEEQARNFTGNPVDNLAPLAKAGIPILHLCGDADEVVMPDENTMVVEKRYRELGGHIEVIYKHGFKHHPHCLTDPTPIVDFVLKYNH